MYDSGANHLPGSVYTGNECHVDGGNDPGKAGALHGV